MRYGEFGDWLTDTRSYSSLTPHRFKHCVAFINPADAMEQVAEFYRKALWADADVRFEIWVEDAPDDYAPPIAGLYACRGFASLTFIHDTAEAIYYLGAYDECGAADRIAETLAKLASEPILAQRLAVLPEQIAAWPARRVNSPGDCKYQDEVFFSFAPPDDLHDHLRQVIEAHLPFEEFEILRIAKESDRQVYLKWSPWEWKPGERWLPP